MRTRTSFFSLVATLGAATALAAPAVPTGPATAAMLLTCEGLPVTIASSGESVTGTPGPDVILLEGVSAETPGVTIDARAGDDTICVSGESETVGVDLGAGDDSVVVEETPAQSPLSLDVDLGLGANTVRTAGGDDTVLNRPGNESLGDGPDDVSTGAGDDEIYVVRGEFPPTEFEPGPVDAGPGRDLLQLEEMGYVNLRRKEYGTASFRDRGLPFQSVAGVEDVSIANHFARIISGSADNAIRVDACTSTVRTGRGDDTIGEMATPRIGGDFLSTSGSCASEETLDRWFGNQGDDRLVIPRLAFSSEVFGGPGDDVIKNHDETGAANRMSGGGGDDRIVGGPRRDIAYGGNGNDVLKGRQDNDRLIGGKGRDVAFGGQDADRCKAERERSCEK